MPLIPVRNLGKVGLVTDQPHEDLPLNAFTAVRNMRFRGGSAEKFTGQVQVFGTPLHAPDFLMPVTVGGTVYWLYASDAAVAALDGVNHADITRVAGAYTGNPGIGWTGTVIEKIAVLNNGIEVPQMWSPAGLTTKLVDLANWPADLRANTIFSMKRYLVALDVTKAGARFQTMIKWSHQAPGGSVPSSWDESDETVDAGEWLLPDDGGYLIDGVPLRDDMVLYREAETWLMRFVGGIDVFRFTRLFPALGMLSRHCACEFMGGRQLVFTGEDIVIHDGQNPQSLMTERIAAFMRDSVDLSNITRSFVAPDYRNKEVWVCFPEPGQAFCTKAVVWNWTTNTLGTRELPGSAFAVPGIVSESDISETWEGAVGTWETDNVAWKDRASDPTKRRLLLAQSKDANRLLITDLSEQFAGQNMQCLLERRGIGFPLKDNQPPDYTRMKQVTALWPKIVGTRGAVIAVSVGLQDTVDDDVEWCTAQSYVIGETDFCDFSDTPPSRIHSVKFESDSNLYWKISGYDAVVVDRGEF